MLSPPRSAGRCIVSGENVKFLHASDLHLDQPMSGLSEIPDHIEDLLVDAPLQAAATLFETAVMEDVDFVVLSGDVLDPHRAGPRVLSFLLQQFELLADQRISVYWCGGQADPHDAWPEDVALPANVLRFPTGQLKAYVHRRGETPIANVMGIGSAGSNVPVGEYRTQPSNLFTVAIAHGNSDAASLAAHKQIDYWALGGMHQSKTVFQTQQTALIPDRRRAGGRTRRARMAGCSSRWIMGAKCVRRRSRRTPSAGDRRR